MSITIEKINPSSFFKYFEKCYAEDNNRFIVENLGQAKYQYKHYITEKEELMSGRYPLIPFFHKKEKELLADIELYKLEKQLYYAAFFVLGTNESTFSKNKNLFAPLILYPAKIESEDGQSYLRLNRNEGVINSAILSKLNPVDGTKSVDSFLRDCEDFFFRDIPDAFLLKRSLEKHFTNIEAEELIYFPHLWKSNQITKYLKNPVDKHIFKVVPGSIVTLVPKINNALKVVEDLKKIEKQYYFGNPISELLNRETDTLRGDRDSVLKHQLNRDQFKALQNAQQYHNSIIVGPPGTGKSYTICAIAVDCVLRGQSVLIVSKTKSAVEVLRNMLIEEYTLKKHIVHTSGHSYKRSLEAKLKRLLSGIYGRNKLNEATNNYKWDVNHLANLEQEFLKRVGAEVDLGIINNQEKTTIKETFKKLYIQLFVNLDESIWDLFFNLEKHNKELTKSLKEYVLQRIDFNTKEAVSNHRTILAEYYQALKSQTFSEYKDKVDTLSFHNVLKAFPLWLAHFSELNAVLPTQKELFDVVIVDEATQCDIASVLPAIYRAKRVVIAGDPKQLKHYSFISRKKQKQFLEELSLPEDALFNYRDKSILDIYLERVQYQEQVSFLREHFRSSSKIIGFSNEKFYDDQLQILKATPDLDRRIETLLTICEEGKREEKGYNSIEAENLLLTLDELIAQNKEDNNPPSIGVLSVFGDQVDYLKRALKDRYGIEILKRNKILCGTPYHFQGNERDIMLISLCIDNKSHHSAFRYINRPDVLNVAITRAKNHQHIFHSLNVEDLDSKSLLYQYLHYLEEEKAIPVYEKPIDQFQKEVYDELNNNGYEEVLTNFPLGGQLLDILIIKNGQKVFIDLIGDEGDFSNHFSLERYKTFSRIGILSFPILYSFWKGNKTVVLKRLDKLFG